MDRMYREGDSHMNVLVRFLVGIRIILCVGSHWGVVRALGVGVWLATCSGAEGRQVVG